MEKLFECKKCKKMKKESEFSKDKYASGGIKKRCKECLNEEKRNKKRKIEQISTTTQNEKENENKNLNNLNNEKITEENKIEEPNKNEKNIINPNDVQIISKELDLSKIWEKGKHYSCVLLAARRSGKTTLLVEYLYPYFESMDYDMVIFFNKTNSNDIYKGLKHKIDPNFIFEEYDERVISTLKFLQKETNNAFNIAIIFDDTIGWFTNTGEFIDLFCIGRNFNFTIIFCTQTVQFFYTTLRENTDFLLLFGFHTKDRCDNTYDHLIRGRLDIPVKYKASIRSEEDYFWYFMKLNCANYRKLLFDFTRPQIEDFNDKIFYIEKDVKISNKKEKEKQIEEKK